MSLPVLCQDKHLSLSRFRLINKNTPFLLAVSFYPPQYGLAHQSMHENPLHDDTAKLFYRIAVAASLSSRINFNSILGWGDNFKRISLGNNSSAIILLFESAGSSLATMGMKASSS